MNLFGCKFCVRLDDGSRLCERKNFDSLLWAIITVFQVIFLKMKLNGEVKVYLNKFT